MARRSCTGSMSASPSRCVFGRLSTKACCARSTTSASATARTSGASASRRGRYVTSELEGVLTGDHIRADGSSMSVERMGPRSVEDAGVGFLRWHPSRAVHGGAIQRGRAAIRRPRRRHGCRDPTRRRCGTFDEASSARSSRSTSSTRASTSLRSTRSCCLRPTESATVFLQQLGRGLRWAAGKSVLTVLDFIGQAHADYRFDVRFRAMVGGTRRQVERALETGFPLMPPGCAIRLDEIAQEIVLENLRSSIRNTRRALVDDLRGLPATTSLAEFLEVSSFDLPDVYSNPSSGTTFTSATRAAGHRRGVPDPGEAEFAKALGKMLHVDDEERYQRWRSWLDAECPAGSGRRLDLATSGCSGCCLRLLVSAGARWPRWPRYSPSSGRRRRCARSSSSCSMCFVIAFALIRVHSITVRPMPIHSHATYGLYEIIAAYGLVSNGVPPGDS